jgi:hypothetical protein
MYFHIPTHLQRPMPLAQKLQQPQTKHNEALPPKPMKNIIIGFSLLIRASTSQTTTACSAINIFYVFYGPFEVF